jgi:hypothetical protein
MIIFTPGNIDSADNRSNPIMPGPSLPPARRASRVAVAFKGLLNIEPRYQKWFGALAFAGTPVCGAAASVWSRRTDYDPFEFETFVSNCTGHSLSLLLGTQTTEAA